MPLICAVQTGPTRSLPVIARSPCDEAIQTVSGERFWIASAFAKGFGGQVASLAMTESVMSCVAGHGHRIRSLTRKTNAYSSLPRVMAMDASVLVRVHSMLRRR